MTEKINGLLRQIPKVDELQAHPKFTRSHAGAMLTVEIRRVLDGLRDDILRGRVDVVPGVDSIVSEVADSLKALFDPRLQRVINGTGIILHTNLGRACLARTAAKAVSYAAKYYTNLEYCITDGHRSSRHVHVEDLLIRLTGCEAAMVVNNNAAAVLLALSAVAHQKDVIVSRGELVEIGGSFRVPDVLMQSGCRLVEVGTTNKTHVADYERAILASDISGRYNLDSCESGSFTGAILRVHTSNFTISGFTSKPCLEELAGIAMRHDIPLIEDLGSGCMLPLAKYGIHDQPVVSDSVKAGVDIITFSGDKLFGGPQAGIIVGKASHIAKMKAHPLARAMRMDKMCLGALEATLRLYLNPDIAIKEIPTLRMLCISQEELYARAEMLVDEIMTKWNTEEGLGIGDSYILPVEQQVKFPAEISIIEETSQVGGGAMPEEKLATVAVSITSNLSAQAFERHMRLGNAPIIGRISRDRFILDVRTLEVDDFSSIAWKIKRAFV